MNAGLGDGDCCFSDIFRFGAACSENQMAPCIIDGEQANVYSMLCVVVVVVVVGGCRGVCFDSGNPQQVPSFQPPHNRKAAVDLKHVGTPEG